MKDTETELLNFLRVIARRDRHRALQDLAKAPDLAQMAVKVGASHENAGAFFLRAAGHYAYVGDTPLHFAAAAYERSIAEALIGRGGNVGARNRRGAEPLHYAADGAPDSVRWDPAAQSSVIEFLIGAGANRDTVDKGGVTPLHRAVRTRCAAAVRTLLAQGADALRRNGSGSTPLHLAVQNTGRGGSGSIAARQEQAEIIRLLLTHGASASDKDSAGIRVKERAKSAWILDLLER